MSDYLETGRKYLEEKISGRENSVSQYESIEDIVQKNEYRDSNSAVFLEPTLSASNIPSSTNNYRNPLLHSYDKIIDSTSKIDDAKVRQGVRSMVNPFALLSFHKGDMTNLYEYINSNESRTSELMYENLSVEKIVTSFNENDYPTKPYRYADFCFLKYFEKIPENRIITLRRYPFPTFDNLEFPNTKEGSPAPTVRPVAQAVTYFGSPTNNSLKSIMGVKGSIGWKKLTAEYQQKDGTDQGIESSPFGLGRGVTGTIAKGVALVTGKNDVSQAKFAQIQYEKNFDWSNTVRGESNVIKDTYIREKGISAGIETYNIEFEYEMRSFNGVNGKVAMLDVIFNFLSLVYNRANFWGGERRFFPNSPRYPFIGDQDAFYRGDYGTYAQSIAGDLSSAMGTIGSTFAGILGGLLQGDFSSLMNTMKKMGSSLMDISSGKNRPQMINFKALLSGEPIGEWHLTVGSPFDPILMIGNLIVNDWSLEFGEELGVDNFPTTFKFMVTLKDGMPRDKGGLESMFIQGNGHGYLKPKQLAEIVGADGNTVKFSEDDVKRAGGSVY